MGEYVYKMKKVVELEDGKKVALFDFWYKPWHTMFPTPAMERADARRSSVCTRLRGNHNGGYDLIVTGEKFLEGDEIRQTKCKTVACSDYHIFEDNVVGTLHSKRVGRKKVWYMKPVEPKVDFNIRVSWKGGQQTTFRQHKEVKGAFCLSAIERNQVQRALEQVLDITLGAKVIDYGNIKVENLN